VGVETQAYIYTHTHNSHKTYTQSVVLSGGYEDDRDEGEWFLYTGSGGKDLSGNKRTNKVCVCVCVCVVFIQPSSPLQVHSSDQTYGVCVCVCVVFIQLSSPLQVHSSDQTYAVMSNAMHKLTTMHAFYDCTPILFCASAAALLGSKDCSDERGHAQIDNIASFY